MAFICIKIIIWYSECLWNYLTRSCHHIEYLLLEGVNLIYHSQTLELFYRTITVKMNENISSSIYMPILTMKLSICDKTGVHNRPPLISSQLSGSAAWRALVFHCTRTALVKGRVFQWEKKKKVMGIIQRAAIMLLPIFHFFYRPGFTAPIPPWSDLVSSFLDNKTLRVLP